MSALLVIFFISLLGIIVMVWRKISRKEELINEENVSDMLIDMPYVDEIKYMTAKKLKKYGYVVLLSSIRLSMKSTKAVKKAGNEIGEIVKRTLLKNKNSEDPKEVSKFLQMVSEYKNKIKHIKKRIREEEGLN